MNNTNYGAADRAAMINGGWMLINRMIVNYNNVNIMSEMNINHCVNIKALNEFNKGYGETIGELYLNYLDTSNANTNANLGHKAKHNITTTSREFTFQVPLRLYSFFESCENNLLPNGRLSFGISFESDDVLIHRAAGDAGKVVVMAMELYAPKLGLTILGQELFSRQFLVNRIWNYLK